MDDYHGIIIRESLKDPNIIDHLPVISKKDIGSWQLILVSVGEADMEVHIETIQKNMIRIIDDCWYAHYFRKDEVIVVFQDKTFHMNTKWNCAIEYGVSHGIPLEQLDFKPHQQDEAISMFQIANN